MPGDRAPDGIVPLIGYRMWRVGVAEPDPSLGPYLFSWNGEAWEPKRWTTADCRILQAIRGMPTGSLPDIRVVREMREMRINHFPPEELCECGLYAWKTLELARGMAGTFSFDPELSLLGKVHLAGKVIEHERGYRAQHAKVVELYPFVRPSPVLRRAAGVYEARLAERPITVLRPPPVRRPVQHPPPVTRRPLPSVPAAPGNEASPTHLETVLARVLQRLGGFGAGFAWFCFVLQGNRLGTDVAVGSAVTLAGAAVIRVRRRLKGRRRGAGRPRTR